MSRSIKGSIVIARSGTGRRFLMVRHSERAWEFPGGRIEPGEMPLETAGRELKEETGLTGHNWNSHGIVELENGDLALFSCRVSGAPHPDTGEIAEARYFTAPPIALSFPRPEYFRLMRLAGIRPKPKTDYDTTASSFDSIRKTSGGGASIWTDALARLGRMTSGARVLDAGCGTGRYTLAVAGRTGAEIIGLDASRGMLERANSKERGVWLQGDITTPPFRSGRFDAVIMMLVLQHVDDEPLALSEAWRVLKPGGRLVAVTVSHTRIRRHIMRHFPGAVRIDLDRFMPVPELKWHLASIGFEGVRHHRIGGPPETEAVDKILDRFRRRYISTLALVPPGDFEEGMRAFERNLRAAHDDTVASEVEMVFVEGRKPDG